MNFVYLMPNDPVLVYYHYNPFVISYFRCFSIFTPWVVLYKPTHLCNPKQLLCNFSFYVNISRRFQFRVCFSLFSLLFLSFSRLPNTPLEDDNSRDAWLSLIALKRRVASLILGLLSSCIECYRYYIYGSQLSKLGFNAI